MNTVTNSEWHIGQKVVTQDTADSLFFEKYKNTNKNMEKRVWPKFNILPMGGAFSANFLMENILFRVKRNFMGNTRFPHDFFFLKNFMGNTHFPHDFFF